MRSPLPVHVLLRPASRQHPGYPASNHVTSKSHGFSPQPEVCCSGRWSHRPFARAGWGRVLHPRRNCHTQKNRAGRPARPQPFSRPRSKRPPPHASVHLPLRRPAHIPGSSAAGRHTLGARSEGSGQWSRFRLLSRWSLFHAGRAPPTPGFCPVPSQQQGRTRPAECPAKVFGCQSPKGGVRPAPRRGPPTADRCCAGHGYRRPMLRAAHRAHRTSGWNQRQAVRGRGLERSRGCCILYLGPLGLCRAGKAFFSWKSLPKRIRIFWQTKYTAICREMQGYAAFFAVPWKVC